MVRNARRGPEDWAAQDAELETEWRFWDVERSERLPWLREGTVFPAELEEQINELAESVDGLPMAMAVRRLESGFGELLAYYDDPSSPRAQTPRKCTRRRGKPQASTRKTSIHRERAIRGGVASTLTDGEWLRILDAFGQRCVYCDTVGPCTIDHIIPMSSGGGNTAQNVVPACWSCNSSKSDSDLLVWLDRKEIDACAVFRRIEAGRAGVAQAGGDQ